MHVSHHTYPTTCKQRKCRCVCKFWQNITVLFKHFNESGSQVGSISVTLQKMQNFKLHFQKILQQISLVSFCSVLVIKILFLFSTGYSSRLLKFLSWRIWTFKMHIRFLRNDQALCVCA